MYETITATGRITIHDLHRREGMSARERAKRLNDWANELSAVGRLAMDDPNLAARLGLVLAPRDFLSLYRELGKTHSGDKLETQVDKIEAGGISNSYDPGRWSSRHNFCHPSDPAKSWRGA